MEFIVLYVFLVVSQCAENMFLTDMVITEVLKEYPDQEIWIWTGYTIDELVKRNDSRTDDILSKITGIVDGPFIQEQRDITLNMRGSKNQRIIQLKNTDTKLPEETIQYKEISNVPRD